MSVTISDAPSNGGAAPALVPAATPTVPATPFVPPIQDERRPAPAPAAVDPNTPPTDPDALELWEARRAAAAEKAPAGQPPAPAPAAKPPVAASGPVPYERFHQVVNTANAWKARAEQLEAALAAKPPAPAPAAQPGDFPVVTVADVQPLIAQAEAQIFEAVDKYDAGEIPMKEMVTTLLKGVSTVMRCREDLVVSLMRQEVRAAAPQVGVADQLLLERQIQDLERSSPWLAMMTDQHIALLGEHAKTELAARGTPVDGSLASTMRLRAMAADLSNLYGPRWFPGQATPTAPAPQNPAPAAPARPAAPAPRPQAPRAPAGAVANAIRTASAYPPSQPAAAGIANTADITAAQIDAMSDEELEALPPAIRRRVLTGT